MALLRENNKLGNPLKLCLRQRDKVNNKYDKYDVIKLLKTKNKQTFNMWDQRDYCGTSQIIDGQQTC